MKIHIVQKGDTLWKLAKKYGVHFEELKKLNSQLSNPDMIMPGMKIKIPGVGASKNPATSQSNTKINVNSKKETVMSGILKPVIKEAPQPSEAKPIVKEMAKPNVTKP
ncbi:SafA/ExsA family spore coat assembly protein, partial [Bacillus sp. JJ722]|uniref:SafA/ExsA family spore coat assembly protein n=1 Tax=Bacillus sp. JJ722 TaxID=3122973 RepID=UPI002FFDC807